MNVVPTVIPDVLLIEPRVFGDERGFFFESWRESGFAQAGIDARFVQDNQSRSSRGVLRGMHYQLARPQGKLVRVTAGAVFDVAVDLRRSSPTFGQWVGAELTAINKHLLWVPPGFAHGFVTLEDGTDFLYKCTDDYAPEDEHTLAWDDPAIAIAWPIDGLTLTLSAKDRAGAALSACPTYA